MLASGDPDATIPAQLTEGLLRAERNLGVESETIVFDDYDISEAASRLPLRPHVAIGPRLVRRRDFGRRRRLRRRLPQWCPWRPARHRVPSDYSGTFGDPNRCERLANSQIDAGSDVVLRAAGPCGEGALSAAGTRGVWGVAVDSDQPYLGPHILASVVKRFDRALELAVRRHLDGILPGGVTLELGIADNAVGLVGVNPHAPSDVRAKLARETLRVRDAR